MGLGFTAFSCLMAGFGSCGCRISCVAQYIVFLSFFKLRASTRRCLVAMSATQRVAEVECLDPLKIFVGGLDPKCSKDDWLVFLKEVADELGFTLPFW